jgi:hypothetical protein
MNGNQERCDHHTAKHLPIQQQIQTRTPWEHQARQTYTFTSHTAAQANGNKVPTEPCPSIERHWKLGES